MQCKDAVDETKTYCAEVFRDSRNCGACGVVCNGGTACQQGRCVSTGSTAPGVMACPGPNGAPMCVAVYRDANNCGTCGRKCQTGQACDNGNCVSGPTCQDPMKVCFDPAANKQYCTDLNHDRYNCGKCGTRCEDGLYCKLGQCVTPPPPPDGGMTEYCPQPLKPCVGPQGQPYCADFARDPRNCGGCNISCVSNICESFACKASGGTTGDGGTAPPPTCSPPTLACTDPAGYTYCADVGNDPKNCGYCGLQCPAGHACIDKACKPLPPQ
jgi:hypothetical protein